MINNSEEFNTKSSYLFWEDDGQNKVPTTPSTLSPASLHEINSPSLNNQKTDVSNAIFCKTIRKRNTICIDENKNEEIISSEIPCLTDNSIGMLGWSQNIVQENLQHESEGNELFEYSYYSNNTDEMFQNEEKFADENIQYQLINSKTIENDKKLFVNKAITSMQLQDASKDLNLKLINRVSTYNNSCVYNVTDTVFKEIRSENSSKAKDISRYMNDEYLELLKTNLMLEFTKSRTCYLKLVPSVIEIFNIMRDAPDRCPIPIVQSIDDLGKEKNIEKFENYFLNCVSKQNCGFLTFCTEKRALKSGGGGKYYFFDKKLQLNGCHKVDVLNHHKQKNIMGPVFMKVLLFMFVVDPPYHMDPRARSSNPQRLMDFYYQLKSMNKLGSIKRLLKVWCMEMCPEEYLDAGYPLGSLLWVSTLDIESHIKKWRYRGKKSMNQMDCSVPNLNNFEKQKLLPESSLLVSDFSVNERNNLISNKLLDGLNTKKKENVEHPDHENIIQNEECSVNVLKNCNNSVTDLLIDSNSKSLKKSRNRARSKTRSKCLIVDEETENFKKRAYANKHNQSYLETTNESKKNLSSESIIELELELGMEFEQVSNFGYLSQIIWDLVRALPIESLNRLYISWLDGNIPGLTKLIVNTSSAIHGYLNMQNEASKFLLQEDSSFKERNKNTDSFVMNSKSISESSCPRKTILYHKALYLVIQQHLLIHSSELQALLKALEENNTNSHEYPENLENLNKNLDVIFNSPLRMIDDNIEHESIIQEIRIRNESKEKIINSCDEGGDSHDISRNNISDQEDNILGNQNLSESIRLCNAHDSSSIFSIVASSQYQEFIELPEITSNLSEQLMNDHNELSKHCSMNEPIDLFFAIG